MYDTWNVFDPDEADPFADRTRLQQRLEHDREIVRAVLPHLRREIENPNRDMNSVFEALRPYHHETSGDVPMGPEDLPELQALCRLVLERGGLQQNRIQTILLRLIGATAALESVPFLLDMLHFSRRGDHFGPERRQLALWGLARVAILHGAPEPYQALRESLDDHHAEVRYTAADLILNAYLSARRRVPKSIVDKLMQMARFDPDRDVRRSIKIYLREPWADNKVDDGA
jgi:hypothetical protein